MDLTTDFSTFQKAVTDALLTSTRTAGQIASEDLSFHRSSSSAFSASLDAQNVRLLHLTNRLLRAAASGSSSDIRVPQLEDEESVEDNWRGVVDVVDDLLERADRCLDEYTGVIKRLSPRRDVAEGRGEKGSEARGFGSVSRFASKIMKKPQEEFERKVDNLEQGVWKPLLKDKPHAKAPLEKSPRSEEAGYSHPYAEEIAQYSYPKATYAHAEPIKFTPPEESEAVFVDTEQGVMVMLEELKKADVIAVDLEHHDMHSYVGLVSLMQISTRDKDWIVDTLKPWRENLSVLNEVFTDPNILKVFHGSTMDMIWLQRDLGLYVVGLFDTYHAAYALSFPKKSLKYLLERFAQFDAQKVYQMSDWRIRPIPPEMLDYARSDTHYLLNVFDQIRNLLVEASSPDNNLIDYVLEQSKKEALQRYERPVYDREHGLGPIGWYGPLARRSVRFTNEQFAVYRALHEWRDNVARQTDEGVGATLSINSLFNIANAMPTTAPALFAAANPISRAVKERQKDILELVKKAKDEGREGPSLLEVIRENDALLGPAKSRRRAIAEEKTEKDAVANTTGNLDPVVTVDSLASRTLSSQLWGPTMPSTERNAEELRTKAINSVISRIIPIPSSAQLANSLSSTTIETTSPTQPTATTTAVPTPSEPEDNPNTVFTIRDLGTPTPRNSHHDALAEGKEEVAINIGADGLTKTERKARRKEEKRLKKAAQDLSSASSTDLANGNTTTTAVGAKEEMKLQPFDYASAPSVLHAASNEDEAGGRRRRDKGDNKKRPFDPYAKAMDTTKGVKRSKKDGGGGKSFTFRS